MQTGIVFNVLINQSEFSGVTVPSRRTSAGNCVLSALENFSINFAAFVDSALSGRKASLLFS